MTSVSQAVLSPAYCSATVKRVAVCRRTLLAYLSFPYCPARLIWLNIYYLLHQYLRYNGS